MKPIKLTLLALYIGYIINIAFAFDFNPGNVTFAIWCMSAIISAAMPLAFYVLGEIEREEKGAIKPLYFYFLAVAFFSASTFSANPDLISLSDVSTGKSCSPTSNTLPSMWMLALVTLTFIVATIKNRKQ